MFVGMCCCTGGAYCAWEVDATGATETRGRGAFCDVGVGARELPLLARALRLGFVLPFAGGGVTELDQCRMLLRYTECKVLVSYVSAVPATRYILVPGVGVMVAPWAPLVADDIREMVCRSWVSVMFWNVAAPVPDIAVFLAQQ